MSGTNVHRSGKKIALVLQVFQQYQNGGYLGPL